METKKTTKKENYSTLVLNQKMKNAVAWIEKTYGECDKRMLDCGILLVESRIPNYKIHFHVYKNGLIG